MNTTTTNTYAADREYGYHVRHLYPYQVRDYTGPAQERRWLILEAGSLNEAIAKAKEARRHGR